MGKAPLGVILRLSGSGSYTLMLERFRQLDGFPGAAETYNMSMQDDESKKLWPGMLVTHSNGLDLRDKPFQEALALVTKMSEARPLSLRFADHGFCLSGRLGRDPRLAMHFVARCVDL